MRNKAHCLSPKAKYSPIAAELAADGIQIAAYDNTIAALSALPADSSVLIDPRRVTFGLRSAIPASAKVIEAINLLFLRNRKTAGEAQLIREDDGTGCGAALCEFFSWLEQSTDRNASPKSRLTNKSARHARQPHFISPSFGTIAGFNANGAMPHYRATPASHAVIEGDGLLASTLAVHLNGTTDITRVVAIGEVRQAQKRDFTLVLKGS
jgi:Xaa-Pro aminopeptidase